VTEKDRPDDPVRSGDALTPLGELQTAFAAHIRDPENQPAPGGVEDRRMKIYRDLFFNNIQTMLAGNFPVLRALYSEPGWLDLVRDFYAHYRCHTPLFTEIAREFLRYLQDFREVREQDPPFLLELAHYEWVEMALELDARELSDIESDPAGDLLEDAPVLSPLAWPLSYRFPVHRISPDFRPQTPPDEPTHILVYRNREDEVKFMQMNNVSRLLLEFLQEDPDRTGLELLNRVAGAIRHPDPEVVIRAGRDLLDDLRNRDVLLGTRRQQTT
jgi:hypothetical protein